MTTVRHVQLVIAEVALGPRPLPLRHGTLQVVERVGGSADGSLDWEVVLHTIDHEPVAHASHPLSLQVIVGADEDGRLLTAPMDGAAILVRGLEQALVFRGNGPLGGFDMALLG